MPSTRLRPAFRRFALSLAAAQLLAYAAAPVIEAVTERPSTGAHVEAAHTRTCVVLHAPDACLACQLLAVSARRPDGTCLTPERSARMPIGDRGMTSRAPRAPPGPFLTRAPPSTLG